MAIPDFSTVGDAVAFNNAKMFGDAGANVALQSAIQHSSHNNRMNALMESVAAMWAEKMATPDPVEAASTQKIMSGSDAQQQAVSMGLINAVLQMATIEPGTTTTP